MYSATHLRCDSVKAYQCTSNYGQSTPRQPGLNNFRELHEMDTDEKHREEALDFMKHAAALLLKSNKEDYPEIILSFLSNPGPSFLSPLSLLLFPFFDGFSWVVSVGEKRSSRCKARASLCHQGGHLDLAVCSSL